MLKTIILITLCALASSLADDDYVSDVTHAFDLTISRWSTAETVKIRCPAFEAKFHHYQTLGTILIPVSTSLDKWSFGPLENMTRLGSLQVNGHGNLTLINSYLSVYIDFNAHAEVRPIGLQEFMDVVGRMYVEMELVLLHDFEQDSLAVRTLSAEIKKMDHVIAISDKYKGLLDVNVADEVVAVGPRQLKVPITSAIRTVLREASDNWTEVKRAIKPSI
ncbi:hypothetical protein HDE_12536 [Halotydeus destructor]|nr:hypothetical protein HDE_12536 [Halotydeus destructor]